jgi:hypothetical protein
MPRNVTLYEIDDLLWDIDDFISDPLQIVLILMAALRKRRSTATG